MHDCLNVVANDGSDAGAVLIRAIEPRLGVELMRARRPRPDEPDSILGAGPARLCQALAVTRIQDGHDLTLGTELWLAESPELDPAFEIKVGPRIGVDYAGPGWVERPWRFSIAGNASVSR